MRCRRAGAQCKSAASCSRNKWKYGTRLYSQLHTLTSTVQYPCFPFLQGSAETLNGRGGKQFANCLLSDGHSRLATHQSDPTTHSRITAARDAAVAEWLECWTQAQKAWVQIAAATL